MFQEGEPFDNKYGVVPGNHIHNSGATNVTVKPTSAVNTYKGGYGGGHNSSSNNNVPPSQSNESGGYKPGNLYK